MPTRDGYREGIPSWVDLATTDIQRAKGFYAALFGWEYREEETDSIPYTMALKKGLSAAGMGPASDERPFSVWSTHFTVDDADATVERVKDAGGSVILEPVDVMDAGRLAIVSDPTGATFGIWQAGNHFGAAIVNEHGALNWNELQSDDLETALPFYEKVFGHGHETSHRATGPYTTLSVGDRAIAGAMPPPNEHTPNNWGVTFAVDDAETAMEVAKANGGKVLYGPMEIPGVGKFAGITDPTGARFTIIELAFEID